MQQRVLGRTGRRLSVIGFGGIVVCEVSPAEAAAFVDRAIERGINYFDSVLLPINLFCWRDGGFGSRVCAKALEKGTGMLTAPNEENDASYELRFLRYLLCRLPI